jgi:protease YdgD
MINFRHIAVSMALMGAGFASAAALEPVGLVLSGGFESGAPDSRDYARLLQQVTKPGARPGPASGISGDDSCRWANDFECDEPGIGTGACTAGTDYSDCWRVMAGVEDDSCQWANDGECDEPRFGTGACTQATDATDCGAVSHLRFQNDQCDTAFNGVCEDPERGGNGACEARSDRADCFTRERPLTINDHFFGRDDRVIMDTGAFPWSVIGYVTFDSGGTCTASLVSPRVVATAAHCISEENRIMADGVFTTGEGLPGGARMARVVDFIMDPQWNEQVFSEGDTLDGTDWALLRLDQPLGDELGHLGVLDLDRASRRQRQARLWQAGYSWDTGTNLSGNTDCQILDFYRDNTMSHDCDTTRGDSGSPFMMRDGEDWLVVATDSNFRSNPGGPMIYIAARSSRWAGLVDDFDAGLIGNGGLRLAGTGKPGAPAPLKK